MGGRACTRVQALKEEKARGDACFACSPGAPRSGTTHERPTASCSLAWAPGLTVNHEHDGRRRRWAATEPSPCLTLSPDQCSRLLDKLCVRLGFCLPPVERQRLAENPPREVLTFTDAVFVAEEMDPVSADRDLYRQVRDLVREAFVAAETPRIQEALGARGQHHDGD